MSDERKKRLALLRAADRWRRWRNGEKAHEIYHGRPPEAKGFGWFSDMLNGDKATLADACLSLLPKGDIPQALETPQAGQKVWYFDLGGDTVHESVIKVRENMQYVCVYGSEDYWDTITPGGTPVFATEADAKLALHWQKFQELKEIATAT